MNFKLTQFFFIGHWTRERFVARVIGELYRIQRIYIET